MPSKRLFVIGTNLMVLVYVHSFVLLTANFEDVKKLAQKFVSESIAETIAEFVAKVTGTSIDINTSKANNSPKTRHSQLDSDSVSEEDKETNVTKKSISKENMKYKSKTLKTHKERFQSKFLKSSEDRSNKRKEKKKQNKGNKKSKMKYVSKSNNLNDFSEDSTDKDISVESKDSYLDEGVPDKNLTSDQDEDSASDYVFSLKNKSKDGKYKVDRSFTLTSRKEKIEFDQYDNTNYPKAVATSGSVTLKRLLDSRKSRYRD